MKQVPFDAGWPESIRQSHEYDRLELWGGKPNCGYVYAYRSRFDVAIRLVRACAAPPARVLDLAAAQGNFTLTLAEIGYRVVWNDLRAELADYVRQKYEFGDVEYRGGNIFDLPPEAVGKFDVVLATEIIEHVAHPDQFLAKLSTLLNDDGSIVLTTPNGGYFRNTLPRFSDCPDPSMYEAVQFKPFSDGHIFLLHADEIGVLAKKCGLVVEQLRLFTNPLTNGHIKTHILLRVLPKVVVDKTERMTRALPSTMQRKLHVHMAACLRKRATDACR